jgi:hypothetical protein
MFKHKVFISYASEDAEIAQRLYDDLKNAGVELWLNRESITPGRDWKLEIDKALKESTIFLALISSKSTTKEGFTQRELKRALDVLDEKPEGDVFIIPIRVDDCPIFVRLQNYQWVDLFPSYCLTKRAPDVWDSAAFSSIFLASSFSCSQALSTPAHTQVTQTVGPNKACT